MGTCANGTMSGETFTYQLGSHRGLSHRLAGSVFNGLRAQPTPSHVVRVSRAQCCIRPLGLFA